MLNNQIIITDDTLHAYARRHPNGVADATELAEDEWAQLCVRNVSSMKIKLVQCAKCWQLYHDVQWLRTYNTSRGTRVISHQPGEARPDHDYESIETPEHRAYNNRVAAIGEREGYDPQKEAWAPDRKTRADVLLTGTVTIAYENQHSPFSATGRYSAPERNRLAAAAGRTAMWHTASDKVRGQVPILRTDGGLPPEVIENLSYRHEFRSGIYRIEIYTCTVRDGHECPNRKFSGCGKPHARGQVTAGQLDDVIRGAPVGAYMPVIDAQVIRAPKFFWTDQESYDRYLAYIADPDVPVLLDGAPADQAKTMNGLRNGHSSRKEAEFEAMRAQAVDLAPLATPAPEWLVAPPVLRSTHPAQTAGASDACLACGHPTLLRDGAGRPRCWSHKWPNGRPPAPKVTAGRCDAGATPCGAPARLYPAGWLCDGHRPGRR